MSGHRLASSASQQSTAKSPLDSLPAGTQEKAPRHSDVSDSVYEPETYNSQPQPRSHTLTRRLFGAFDGSGPSSRMAERPSNERHKHSNGRASSRSSAAPMHRPPGSNAGTAPPTQPKVGSLPRPVGGTDKLGTFSGVFVPTTLNVLSILMFLRFGFILGQSGVVGMMGECDAVGIV